MKQTFAVIGFSYMLGLIFLNFIFEDYCVQFSVIIVFWLIAALSIKSVRKEKEIPVALITILISIAVFSAVKTYSYAPAIKYADTRCNIDATVIERLSDSSSGNRCYKIKTNSVNDENVKLDLYLYTPYDICADPYDEIEFSSYLFTLGEEENGTRRHFRSKGIYLGAYTKYDIFIHKTESKPFLYHFQKFKTDSMDIISDMLDGEKAGFASGILFGDKVLLSDETLADFSKSGVSHILAVSGLHMSVWVFGLYHLLKKFRTKDKTAALICIAISFVLVCITSFSPSVLRSAIMTDIYFASNLFKRKSDPLNSLGTAVFFICLTNPFIVGNISFLMTVFATLGIIMSAELQKEANLKIANRKGEKIKKYVLSGIIVSFSASLFVFPITVNVFGVISNLNWLTNLLILPALTPCMFFSGALIAYPSFDIITYPLKKVLNILIGYVLTCVSIIAKIPFSFTQAENIILCKVLPIAIALIIFLIYNVRKKSFSVTSLSCFLGISVVTIFI